MPDSIARLITAARTGWLVALVGLLLGVGLIAGLGEAEHTTTPVEQLAAGSDSAQAAQLRDRLPDKDSSTAIVLFTTENGERLDRATLGGLAKAVTPYLPEGATRGAPAVIPSEDGQAAIGIVPVDTADASETKEKVEALGRRIVAEEADGTIAGGMIPKTETALKALLDNPPDLAVFDIKMPKMDGMELLRRLRAESPLPVIFLTSKDDESDEEAGLELGADDYIAKPFSLRLLIARIRAILRRAEPLGADTAPATSPEPAPATLTRGRLFMDPARHQVTWDGQAVSLTVTEFLILEALAIRPGVIKSRNQLMDAAYPDDVFVDDRTVDSHIKRIRRKFRAADPQFDAIETLYGVGYRFSDG